MAKKGTKKKAAKKKAAKKKTARKTTGKRASSARSTTITFKCISDTCAPDKPKPHIGPKKSKVTLKAPQNKVTLQFFDPDSGAPLRPPFEETTTTGPIVIRKRGRRTFTVRADASPHNPYQPTCEDPDCGTIVEPPEMIVP